MYIDDNKEEFIIDKQSKEFTNKELAVTYKCSVDTIRRRCKKWNIFDKLLYIDNNIEDFIHDYNKTGLTQEELAVKYNCSRDTIINRKNKLKLDSRKITKIDWDNFTQETLKKIVNYNVDTGVFTWNENRIIGRKGQIIKSNSKGGYLRVEFEKGKTIALHILAFLYMDGILPQKSNNKIVDHINHIRDDNRWNNLRIVTHSQNNMNSSLSRKNKSGQIGVRKSGNKWRVRIKEPNTNNHFQKYFDKKQMAIAVAKAMYVFYGYHENHGKPLDIEYDSRHKQLIKATPINQTKEEKQEIRQYYINTLEGYEVDHIQPISRGGLHELSNLQYLTAEENRKKGNKYTEVNI